jgi:hypothetical protein
MAKSISSLLIDCLSLFNALVARKDLIAHDAEVPTSLWTDELGRLRVWAANIGGHQTGQSSLDYRLRDASHIKDQVIRLLESLQRSLVDLQEVLGESPAEAENELSDDENTTELEQIYNGLVELINSLFQMSMLIRRPTRHDRILGTRKEDSVTFEPYDRKHVHEKYPRADDLVVDRLGTAISRRRADLKYRERHRAKLSQGINKLYTGTPDDRESTVFSDTIATEFKEPNIQFDETDSNSGISQTSYAPTLLEGGKAITVPPPPKESANEKPFECPYCFFITSIKNRRSWARHVFRDIMPYICIFAGCSTPNRLYDSRREWYRHISTTHMSASTDQTHECPLCQAPGLSASSFERHLGRHLEELALFAVPRPMTDDDIESDQSRHSVEERLPSEVSSEEEVEGEGEADTPPQIRRERTCTFCDTEIRDGQVYSSCNTCVHYYCQNCEGQLSSCRRAGHELKLVYSRPHEDPYLTLGIEKDADPEAIRSAPRRPVLQHQADIVKGEPARAEADLKLNRVQGAYELLSDPTSRAKYDEDQLRRETEFQEYAVDANEGLDATSHRAVVDVPPDTQRVKMDKRSNFGPDVKWTEITKDLVVKEAITQMGYEFEETEYFYNVMSYMTYVSPSSNCTEFYVPANSLIGRCDETCWSLR